MMNNIVGVNLLDLQRRFNQALNLESKWLLLTHLNVCQEVHDYALENELECNEDVEKIFDHVDFSKLKEKFYRHMRRKENFLAIDEPTNNKLGIIFLVRNQSKLSVRTIKIQTYAHHMGVVLTATFAGITAYLFRDSVPYVITGLAAGVTAELQKNWEVIRKTKQEYNSLVGNVSNLSDVTFLLLH